MLESQGSEIINEKPENQEDMSFNGDSTPKLVKPI